MSTYKSAGVDQSAADALVPVFATLAKRAARPEADGTIGASAGLFRLGDGRALAVSTDGVGTKIELLRAAGRHEVAGWDAVAMNVDDVVTCGAEPIVCVDYVSIERLDAEVMERIVGGVADACHAAGCALLGGETSQHPGIMAPGSYDVVATAVGIVRLDEVWGPHRVREGDSIVGLASTGPHSNGFSLIRRILSDSRADAPEGLLEPTAIYSRALVGLAGETPIHAAAHITGGGLTGKLARVLPDGLAAVLRRSSWPVPAVFQWIRQAGGIATAEMDATFNMGLGMALVVPDGPDVVARLEERGVASWLVGEVTEGAGVNLI